MIQQVYCCHSISVFGSYTHLQVRSSPSLFLSMKHINWNVLDANGQRLFQSSWSCVTCHASCWTTKKQRRRRKKKTLFAIVHVLLFVIHTCSSFQTHTHTFRPYSYIAQDADQHEFLNSRWLMVQKQRTPTDRPTYNSPCIVIHLSICFVFHRTYRDHRIYFAVSMLFHLKLFLNHYYCCEFEQVLFCGRLMPLNLPATHQIVQKTQKTDVCNCVSIV